MKIGFDWGGVLDTYGEQFAQVARALRAQGHQVYIVSAVRIGQGAAFEKQLETMWMDLYDELVVIECPNWDSHPHLKLRAIQKRGIEWFFDDREDTNILLRHYGILAFTVPRIEVKQ